MIGRVLAICGLALTAVPAAAQILPAAYDVTGVASNDVLNIRIEPSAQSPVIGSFPPNGSYIEVLEVSGDGAWGRVGLPEGNGWVSMRYLAPRAVPVDTIPRPMQCVGTEPFWGLTLGETYTSYSSPDEDVALTLTAEHVAFDGYQAILSGSDGSVWTAIIDRTYCSDGMSDRSFGWQTLIFRTGPEPMLLSGCCTLDAS